MFFIYIFVLIICKALCTVVVIVYSISSDNTVWINALKTVQCVITKLSLAQNSRSPWNHTLALKSETKVKLPSPHSRTVSSESF